MKIVVVPRKTDPFMVEVESDESTVGELKEKISNTCGIKSENQTLVVKGKVLEDTQHLNEFKLHNMSKVFLAIKKDKNPSKKPRRQVSNFEESPLVEMMRKTSTEDISNCIESMKKMLPEYSYMFNDVETVEEILSESKNPDAHLEKQRAIDRMMDRNESEPSGFQELVSRYYKIEEILEKNTENAAALFKQKTVIPEKPDAPSTTRLPSTFGLEAAISSLLRMFRILPDRNDSDTDSEPLGRDLFSSLEQMYSNSSNSESEETPSLFKFNGKQQEPKDTPFSPLMRKKHNQSRGISIKPLFPGENGIAAFAIEEEPMGDEMDDDDVPNETKNQDDDIHIPFFFGESPFGNEENPFEISLEQANQQVPTNSSYIPNVMCPPPNAPTPTPPATTNDSGITKPRVLQLRRKQQEQNGMTKQNE